MNFAKATLVAGVPLLLLAAACSPSTPSTPKTEAGAAPAATTPNAAQGSSVLATQASCAQSPA